MREKFVDHMLLILKMEKGAMIRGMATASTNRKRQGNRFFP